MSGRRQPRAASNAERSRRYRQRKAEREEAARLAELEEERERRQEALRSSLAEEEPEDVGFAAAPEPEPDKPPPPDARPARPPVRPAPADGIAVVLAGDDEWLRERLADVPAWLRHDPEAAAGFHDGADLRRIALDETLEPVDVIAAYVARVLRFAGGLHGLSEWRARGRPGL